jgi:pimeloyl-ACP methyl ester carboxylesterase
MATFVLVHGSHHGGWCWTKVRPLLRAAGHEVHTPTLTGLGERVHLATPDVGLTTHVEDVVNVLVYEDLADVVLVGHNSGGRVISGVADRAPERIAHLVYLDAAVLDDGESGLDLYDPAARAALVARVGAGDGWRQPLPDTRFGVDDDADWRWMRPKLVPHPFKAMIEPLRLTSPNADRPATYIYCAADKPPGGAVARAWEVPLARARERRWRYRELPAGHDAMITMPRELADLLLEVL